MRQLTKKQKLEKAYKDLKESGEHTKAHYVKKLLEELSDDS